MNDLISRQAALDAMETWDKFGCDPDGKLVRYDDDKHYIPYVHYEDMVHAIKHLPSAQPECEDAVSRFEVLRLIDYSSHDLNDAVDNRYMQNEIKQLPSVTPKPWKGAQDEN